MLCLLLVGWDLALRAPGQIPARAALLHPAFDFSKAPQLLAQGDIPMPPDTPAAHSSSLLAMPSTHQDAMLAFWFAGSRESAPDIGIAVSGFERASQQWRPAHFVVHREALGRALGFGVRRIGNPVAWLDARQRVHLFVVATGPGGWAASRIVHLRQRQAAQSAVGLDMEVVRILPLSWWWNISYLVRTAPLPLQDGGMVLPVYFEMGIKYPTALRFDAQGEFRGMVRMSDRTHILQPALLAQSETHWLALMRDQRPNGKVTVVQTQDAGRHWQESPDLALVNPDASVAVLALAPDQLWLVHNSSPHSRNLLDLSVSADGHDWRQVRRLAQGSGADEYSYPAMAWGENSLWVSYTDHRTRIAWQRFSWPAR